ncbi:MAG: hypothetical protein ACXAEU_17050 [Candidatus Hodarchaeales archaeon]|jgi:macrodomain Ter protein organizer (MatP/YcbG family)
MFIKHSKPLLFCYVYKSRSFNAEQKLDRFISEIKKSSGIWETLTQKLTILTITMKETIEDIISDIFPQV